MKELLNVLQELHPLTPNLITHLSKKLIPRTLNRKQFLIQPGDPLKEIWFVRKGLIRCYQIADGREISTNFINEGNIVASADNFFRQKPSTGYIKAIEKTFLVGLKTQELEKICQRYSEFNIICRKLLIQSYLKSEQQSAILRLAKAMNKYNAMLTLHPHLVLRIPSRYLASYLNISEGTISRIRKGKY